MAEIESKVSIHDSSSEFSWKFWISRHGLEQMNLAIAREVKSKVTDMITEDVYRYSKKRRLSKINQRKLVLLRAKRRRKKCH